MKIEINIEKKHLVVFSVFLLVFGSISFVLASITITDSSVNPGHSASAIGGGTFTDSVAVSGGIKITPKDGEEAIQFSGSNPSIIGGLDRLHFDQQSSAPSGGEGLYMYVYENDLWFKDNSGHHVKLTCNGVVC